jgi:hypothetical protein
MSTDIHVSSFVVKVDLSRMATRFGHIPGFRWLRKAHAGKQQ